MSRFLKYIIILPFLGFIYFSCFLILKAQYDPPPSVPPNPAPGSCDQGNCSFGCQCGSFICEANGLETFICCSPDCPGGTAPNRRCVQEPHCDVPETCTTADQCTADPDYYHQCGNLAGTSCSVFPHCDDE